MWSYSIVVLGKDFNTAGERFIVYVVYTLWFFYIHNIVTNT